jgi:hypothetical protein
MGSARLVNHKATQDSGRVDRHTLDEARARGDICQLVDRMQANTGRLPRMAVDFVLRFRLERRGVDRTKPEWTEWNAVDHTVATCEGHLIAGRDLLDRLDQRMEGSIVIEIAEEFVKPNPTDLDLDRVNEVDRRHRAESSLWQVATRSIESPGRSSSGSGNRNQSVGRDRPHQIERADDSDQLSCFGLGDG